MTINLMLKRFIGSFITFLFVVIASIFIFDFNTVNAEIIDNQCNGDHTGWTELSNSGGTLTSGNYYLSGNVQLINNITITSGTVNIDLNGYILRGAIGSNTSIFTVTGGTLNIYDCNSSNSVHNYKIKEVMPNSTQDIYYNNANYSNKLFQRYYDFDDVGDGVIVGGIITGGHKFSSATNLSSTFTYKGGGSAFLIGGNSGTVNFYGGTISGNTVTTLSQWGNKRERSGAVGVFDGGTFNLHEGNIVGNSSRNGGAGIYLFGSSSFPARVNIYGGTIRDNYSLDSAYNFSNTSSMYVGGAGLSTDNVGNEASIVSISGTPKIIDNKHYDFTSNQYISTNMSYSTESINSIKIIGMLYKDTSGVRTYAHIGLWGGAGDKLTSNYTISGNTHEDVNKIFFADNKTQAVAYNTLNGELKYVTADLKTLTYAANNGTSDTSTISVVDKISISSSMFNKIGHVFSHWNTSADDSGTVYMPQDIITLSTNQTLYAIWNKASYRIDYWTNGGVFNTSVSNTYTFDDIITLPTPTWSGKTFNGWYDNAMLTGSVITHINAHDYGDKTFYAKWNGVDAYTITSSAGANGSISPLGSIIYDGVSQNYQITPMNGYKVATFTVNGIDKKMDIINNVYQVSGITSDTDIDVTFEKILTTDIIVYLNSDENGTISPKGYSVVSNGDNLTFNVTPNPGYRILDVKVNSISVGAVSTYTLNNITSNLTIYVEFEALASIINSPLNLNYNGGAFTGIYLMPTSYVEGIGVALPSISEVIKANYTFQGWFDNEDLQGVPVTHVLPTDTGAKAYWAKWTINQYTISFDTTGGSAVDSFTQDYNSSLTAPADPTKVGYTFNGWTPSIPSNMPAENMTITALWSINQYTISFNTVGGSDLDAITQDYNSDITSPVDPTKLGYTFAGWSPVLPSNMPAENMTITAQWTINQYTISFNTVGGSDVDAITQDYNSDITAPADPTKLGYTFNGWTPSIPSNMPAENLTLVAQWTINQYTISFDTAGGNVISAMTQDYNSDITAPTNPTKVGYTFTGWSPVLPSNMPAENLTLVAQWTINQYTISFDTTGGNVISAITQDYNSSLTAPAGPTKVGYTFNGWTPSIPSNMLAENMTITALWSINQYTISFDTAGGSAVDSMTQDYDSILSTSTQPTKTGYTFNGWTPSMPNRMPAENMSLVAQWTINQYTISFDTNGGSDVDAITQYYDSILSMPTQPTKTGYTFTGWSSVLPSTMPAENMTITALWSINQYTISFNTVGGSDVDAITQDYNSDITAPTNPTKVGYTFNGWTPSIPSNMPAENMTITALWSINQYTISFNTVGGSDVDAITQDYNSDITAPTDPTKVGYTFTGWSPLLPSNMPAENMTLIAQWTINQYTISFDTTGGNVISAITQDYNSSLTAPADPTKVGYTFTGWSPLLPSNMPAENLTLVAHWTVNQYTISFDTAGGNVISAITQDYNSDITAPTDPTKVGYTFNGWTPSMPSNMPAENLTLVAQWTVNQYTISFDTAGGSDVDAITQNYNSDITAPTDPTKVGYTFTGWSPLLPSNMPAENMTLIAQWTINQYTISFDTTGGNVISAITQDYNSSLTAPTDPTKVGYTFNGWTPIIPSTMPAENITLVAQWSVNQYTISFDTTGGNVISAITQDYNSDITAPADPTKVGYTFNGWTPSMPSNMPAENLTLVAQWTINQYTISFDTAGGNVISAMTQDYNSDITAPTNPTKVGYTFNGWTPIIPSTMPAENITLVAQWSVNQYTISFDTTGGNVISAITQDYNSDITAPTDPTKVGYTFTGWSPVLPSNMPAENLTLVAQWTINQYTISFDTNGGSAVAPITQNYNSTVISPNNPTKEGYTFNGWSPSIPNTMAAEDITIKATWLKVSNHTENGVEINTAGLIESMGSMLSQNKDMEIVVVVQIKQSIDIIQSEIDLIKNQVKRGQDSTLLDIKIILREQGQSDIEVNELMHHVSFTIVIPETVRGYKNYQIMRIHNGQIEILNSVYDSQNHTITFETDKFSTYAIIYDVGGFNGLWLLSLLIFIPIGYVMYIKRSKIKETWVVIKNHLKRSSH